MNLLTEIIFQGATWKEAQGILCNLHSRGRVIIGKYSSQHGPMAASWYFTKKFGCLKSKASAQCFKKQYLLNLEENVGTTKGRVEIKELPIKCRGRPLLFQEETNQSVQEYIKLVF